MIISMEHSRQHISILEEEQDGFNEYYHDMQLYIKPPSGRIRLNNLEQICLNRLRVLKLVYMISAKNKNALWSDCRKQLTEQLVELELHDFAKLINATGCSSHTDVDVHLRRMDHISHFVLRSAFAFEHRQREWFFKQETRLFRWRSSALNMEGIYSFIKINQLPYVPIPQQEKDELQHELSSILPEGLDPDSLNFFKMPFNDVPKLTARRVVFVRSGFAYVPDRSLISLFYTLFKKSLCSSFEYSREIAAQLSDDVRLTDVFKQLPTMITLKTVTKKYGYLSLNELDKVVTSFPLCMRVLHHQLTTKHHLRNGGRLQYCLFLKGIGLSVDDCLALWEREFEELAYDVEYSVRHLYGKVGKRHDYAPRDCTKIINAGDIGPLDSHGCPYKHMPPRTLRRFLLQFGIGPLQADSIVDLTKGDYTAACAKYFEVTHNNYPITTVTHPNSYYDESRWLHTQLGHYSQQADCSGSLREL